MATMESCLSFPLYESLNQDMAIRRFCAARVEQEQLRGGDREEALGGEIQMFLPSNTTSITYPTPSTEEDDLVDSFFNIDYYNEDHDMKMMTGDKPLRTSTPCQTICDNNLDNIFTMENDSYQVQVDPMLIQGDDFDTYFSVEDYEVASEMVPSPSVVVEEVITSHGVDQGLYLVHLLLACAEAVGCRDIQLADSMLNQVSGSVNPWGASLQRVSYCFVAGLKSRLSLLHNVGAHGIFTNASVDIHLVRREEKMEAFHLLYQTTPYIAFGFMTANEAIREAVQGKDSIHIIDLGMEHALQWPSLIRMLASRPEGPPKLRITGIVGDHPNILELETNMKQVIDGANSLGMKLEFHVSTEPVTPSLLTNENLDLGEGETLIFNSIMHLHKYVKESRGSLKVILQAIRKLKPALLTLIEQDANHNGPFFLGRFLESLHYYSAIFDSLEASLPRNSQQRIKIERFHFAEEIRNLVAFEGVDRVERHERADQWRRQLSRAGFQAVVLKCLSQARMMLSVYGCDGYTLACEKGCLLLGWKGRPIMLASAWQVHNVSSS